MANGSSIGTPDLTLAEAISSDLVVCDFCTKVFDCPLLLPCLHTFCKRCIVAMVTTRAPDPEAMEDKTTRRMTKKTSPNAEHDQQPHSSSGCDENTDVLTLRCPTCRVLVTLAGEANNADDDDDDDDGDSNDDQTNDQINEEDEDKAREDIGEDVTDGEPNKKRRQANPNRGEGHGNTTNEVPIEDDEENGTRAFKGDKKAASRNRRKPAPMGTSNSGNKDTNQKTVNQQHQANGITTTTTKTRKTNGKQLSAIKAIVTDSLPINHFLDSMCCLYSHRNDTDRLCAYCKTEGISVEASCLCLPCQDNMCQTCATAHRKTRVTRDHQVASIDSIGRGLFDHEIRAVTGSITCPDHPQSSVSHFCADCFVVACKLCQSRSHYGHSLLSLADATDTFLPEIGRIQTALLKSCPSLSEYARSLSQQITTLTSVKDAAMAEVQEHAESVIQMVTKRKDLICKQLQEGYEREKSNIDHKIVDVRTSERSTSKSASFLGHLTNLGRAEEQMSMYAHIVARRKELVASRPEMAKSKLSLAFCPGPKTETNISILVGKIEAKQIPMGAKENLTSYPLLSNLMPITLSPPILMATIASSSTSTAYPSGLDTDGNMLAVVDRQHQKVMVYDLQQGKLIKEFGREMKTSTTGSMKGNGLRKPFDAAFLPNGIIAVTDPEAASVGMYEWTGKFVGTFAGHMKHPRGIAVNRAGEVVVVDGHLRRLTVHDARSGEMLRTIRPYSSERKVSDHSGDSLHETDCQEQTDTSSLTPPILIDPFYVHITQEGNMVVSDIASPNLKILNPDGMLLAETMDYGTGPDQNLHPSGVCVDKHGYILVADTNNNRVHLGLPDGQMKDTPLLSQADGLSHPVSLCLTQSGQLVIGQTGGQIKLYKYLK